MASEEESRKANQAQREAEAERRLAEKERQERTAECLSWREKHRELSDRFRAQEDLKALRQNKAVREHPRQAEKHHTLCVLRGRRETRRQRHYLCRIHTKVL